MTAEGGNLNRYMLEMIPIREFVSWVHPNKVEATNKAIK